MNVDPISAVMGAGPLGAVLAWALWEIRDMRRRLEALMEKNTQVQEELRNAVEALEKVVNDRNRDEIRKVALEELQRARGT